ncbi:MAG TPA: hypothetical protein VG275_13615 [Solirubrobacteraceae bacterium]|nr:hypothetical protein [Solirubrobacteraceae bacterium]
MTTTVTTHAKPLLHTVTARLALRRPLTRRHLQIALGVLWLLDGVLQAQSFMFTRGFGQQIIAPTGQGQPGFVSGPVHLGATIIAAHPVAWNVLFAGIQVLVGVGLLVRRTSRAALAASIAWALGVWYLGEGLSGLASGHASLLTGAPGSALLYAVLGAAAWPRPARSDQTPASWLVPAWAFLWIAAAGYQLLPSQATGPAVAGWLTSSAGAAPHWLARIDTSLANWVTHHGPLAVGLIAAVYLLIALGSMSPRSRPWALAAGLAVSIAIWVFGQDLGQLYSGRATDPNSAPLIALMAVVLLAGPRGAVITRRRRGRMARVHAGPRQG